MDKGTLLAEQLTSHFDIFEASLNGERHASLHDHRRKALERFNKLGFPSTKDEEWKYTNVVNITKYDYEPAITTATSELDAKILQELPLGDEAHRLVFVNGLYSARYSSLSNLEEGVTVKNLAERTAEDINWLERHFDQQKGHDQDAFTSLNTAYTSNGVLIRVPKNIHVSKPVLLVFIADSSQSAPLIQPRNIIHVEANASIQVVEHFTSTGAQASLTNVVTEAQVDANAQLDYYKIQEEGALSHHIGTTQVNEARDARVNTFTFTLNGGIVRNNLNFLMQDQGVETHLNGLYLLNDRQHVDNHTLVDHANPHCYSNELYKGLISGKGTAVFNGKVMVRPDAQKTNAYQSNSNLLLTDFASVNTKPQLEIFADDVKCSHGATTGQVDEEALFYLRARGLSKAHAYALLMQAFASEVIETVKHDKLKTWLEERVQQRLQQLITTP